MTSSEGAHMHVTVHLVQQATVHFNAADLWPLERAYARFGPDLDSFAAEVTRRLDTDGFIGFRPDGATITVIPRDAIKRLDFTASE